MSKNILEIKHYTKIYSDNKKAVDDLNITVKSGEIHAFIGHNGAGKSTLSHLITGFLTPTSGKLLWQGTDMGNDSIKERPYVLLSALWILKKEKF